MPPNETWDCQPRIRRDHAVITHQYWDCNARSSHVISSVGAWYGGGLTNVGILGYTAKARQNALKVELVKPKDTATRMADEIVRADGVTCFIILP